MNVGQVQLICLIPRCLGTVKTAPHTTHSILGMHLCLRKFYLITSKQRLAAMLCLVINIAAQNKQVGIVFPLERQLHVFNYLQAF